MSLLNFTPREIVSELDRFIIGQLDAKKAVAIALRNRWRRLQLEGSLREEVLPKNILMIGPTGCGKTEIARRLAKLAQAPFIKVEATKFTEVGYVGRDVEQMVRDLVDLSINQTKDRMRKEVKTLAETAANERLLDALVGDSSSEGTREKFRSKLMAGELEDTYVNIPLQESQNSQMPMMDVPGMPGAQMGMISLGDIFGKSGNDARMVEKKLLIKDARDALVIEESDKLLDNDKIIAESIKNAEENGIIFIDEIDKITARSERGGSDVSREGVQRDLLPLIEGTSVSTKHGTIKTDHILFIASGAFHLAKPADLLPELQGRLPNRVELKPLNQKDFVRILTEPEASLIKQYKALIKTEEVDLTFDEDAINEIAKIAAEVNERVENIGARRLQTVLEKLLEDISFSASEQPGQKVNIDKKMVEDKIGALSQSTDLSRFIL